MNERHKVTFEIDTEASCNILPLTDYIKATGDRQGTFISSTQAQLIMHNNTRATPVGKVMLHMEQGGNTHLLHFFVMKSAVMPILGKNSSLGMKLVQILDCDNIQRFLVILSYVSTVMCLMTLVKFQENIQFKLNWRLFLLLTPLADYQFP